MKDNAEFCGHSNRIFCVRFDSTNSNIIASGGWDNTVQIYDIRKKGPIASIYGPHVCGDAIDFKSDGYTMLTGSYRQDNVLELWDLRTFKKSRDIGWEGPKTSNETIENQMDEARLLEDEERKEESQLKENSSPRK